MIEDLYKAISDLRQEIREAIVLKLLEQGKVSYDTISRGYIQYIKALKEKQTEEYNQLQVCVTKIYCGNKKDIRKNLDRTMWFLHEHGRVNLPKKDIERLSNLEQEV